MKLLAKLNYKVINAQLIIFLAISTLFINCVNENEGFHLNPNNPNSLVLSEGFTYTGLKKIVDAQKIYFIDNSEPNGSYIYEISLDYSQLIGSHVAASPDDVYLRAEQFVHIDFNGHIAATVGDNPHIVVLENEGTNIAVINIATKEIKKYTKPDVSLTQAGFDTNGDLFAAGGDSFYKVTNWGNENEATFDKLDNTKLPTITGGDLLFLDHKFRSGSFLSFSRGNNDNDGDGAYLIDIIEKDTHGNPNKVSFQKVFEVDPKVTGACVAGINHLITTHEGQSKANVYSSQGKKLFQIPIKTPDGTAFVAGKGDLASVNNLDGDFHNEHIKNGVIYLSSSEENHVYELNLDNGNHKEIFSGDFNSHIGISNDILFYTNHRDDIKPKGFYALDMKTDSEELLMAGLTGEKVVIFNNQAWVMSNNKLKVLDITTKEIVHTQEFEAIGGGGDLLVSKDQKQLLVFDRSTKKVWEINLADYTLSEPIDLPVEQANGAAYNEDGTFIVSSQGHLYILNENYELIGEKLLGFAQNNGDMASTYFNF
ncbi:MAG: hypothetical protein COB60_00245 [Flavobacteriaceae bacterium]|nr:MAG: hypothetical protein COB60_00245 [Flavobacteriaceae bacterium]